VQLNQLKQLCDKTVILHLTDGEVSKVKIIYVDDEYEDIIADVLETSRPDRYRDSSAVYTIAAVDIMSAELSE